MTRRGVLGALGLASLPGPKPEPEVVVWLVRRCPGCGRDVCFLPRQRRNRCGWCGRVVRRLGVC
jgi:hypothetical protein